VVVGVAGGRAGIRRRRGLGALAAAALALALAASGCSSIGLGGQAAPPRDPAAEATARQPPQGQDALATFYDQQLRWSACQSFRCARLTVPLDYAKPGGATVSIAVLKAEATGTRRGSLVVNPGGPGGSGVQYAASADYIVSKQVRDAYDIVGFDPRGVGSSQPVTCLDDRQLDAFLGGDPTPDTKAEEQAFAADAKAFAATCAAKGGPLLAHVSTIEAAKDMDILRAALASPRLDYLGKSYGTFLGATYADLFPRKVGTFVLDGVVAPDLSSTQVNQGQAEGFETATRAYVADCVQRGGCPLGGSVDAGMQRLRDFLKQLDASPIRVDDPHVSALTEGWGSLGIAAAMYDEQSWGKLTEALQSAFRGDGNDLMTLADSYAERTSSGRYTGNLMQVIYAVNCLDRSDSKDLAHYEAEAKAFRDNAPTWGPFLAWSTVPCGFWPVPANNAPKKIAAAGSGPIVVVGTTRDPATPYAWSKRLADQLDNGHLITHDGDGHTAYMRGSSCVDDAVDAYLLKGTVPAAGLRC
jgi:pimeloyl-ACP methyl ester carboxylesterase